MNFTKFLHKDQALRDRKYFLFDATGKTLGRFASEMAKILRGKHKPTYTPNVDTGDGVIIVNAEKIKVTGAKAARKVYRHYTGWIGGLREIPYRDMLKRKPENVLYRAIRGMMPTKSKLGRQQMKKLRIFKGPNHNMRAQQPIELKI